MLSHHNLKKIVSYNSKNRNFINWWFYVQQQYNWEQTTHQSQQSFDQFCNASSYTQQTRPKNFNLLIWIITCLNIWTDEPVFRSVCDTLSTKPKISPSLVEARGDPLASDMTGQPCNPGCYCCPKFKKTIVHAFILGYWNQLWIIHNEWWKHIWPEY